MSTYLILANNSGGLYGFRHELIEELLKRGEVVASTPFDDKMELLRGTGCKLIETSFDRRGKNLFADISLLFEYIRMIRRLHPDSVLTYTIKPNLYGGLASRITKTPYFANITGLGSIFEKQGFLQMCVRLLYIIALKRAKAVFFENKANMELFINTGMINSKQAYLLSGAGVNLERFSYKEYPKNEVFRFLFMGRIMKEKGIDELLEAMRRLNSDKLVCTLDILGKMNEDYTQVLDAAQKTGYIFYHGVKEDVRPYIETADCFVLPSWHEGMANTNLECAASGRPIITSNIPGCKEAVIESVSGLLCDPKNVNSLYEKMKLMIQMSRRDREVMGIAGRNHMEAEFDKEKVVQMTIDTIRSSI